MATKLPSTTHIERTAHEPRDTTLHTVTLSQITQVNKSIRLLQLTPTKPISHLPGQWLDVIIPSLPKPGGFTITSTPTNPYLELAVQATSNPPAAWLSQPIPAIQGTQLQVRVGGSFIWPPPTAPAHISRVVFVAGGVGINPLISMLGAMIEGGWEGQIVFLYSARRADGDVLFLDRLVRALWARGSPGAEGRVSGLKRGAWERYCASGSEFALFLTGEGGVVEVGGEEVPFVEGRMGEGELMAALGGEEERGGTVCYVCGPAGMTDEVVDMVKGAKGMKAENVLSEKWW